jgi:hypothetical protein
MPDRPNRLLPLTGVLFFALLVATSFVPGNVPDGSHSGPKILAFYRVHSTRVEVSAALVGLAILTGLFFYRYLRDHLQRAPGGELFAGVAFAGAVLFAAGGGISSGTQFALASEAKHLTAPAAQGANLIGSEAAFLLEGAGIATLLIASALAILRTNALPRWTGWFALPFGVIALLPPAGFIGFIGAGVWTLIVSVALYGGTASQRGHSPVPGMAGSSGAI